jgi:signal transduction histidine kinase
MQCVGWTPNAELSLDVSDAALRGGAEMPEGWEDSEHPRRPGKGKRRGRRKLTEEERRYREAQRRVNAKLGFLFHFIPYVAVCSMLLFLTGFRAAFIVAVFWGIGVFFHYFGAVAAPGLKRRMIDREVHREVSDASPRERRSIEGKHARSIEQLSASIAHEIRNPITAAKSLVQQMGEDPASREAVDYAKVALDELDRVERSISHLLRFAREEEIQITELRLADVLDSALETFRDRFQRMGVGIEREIQSPGAMRGDAEKLRRVIINLVGNALDALEEAGVAEPELRILAGENLAGTEVWVRVRDNGPGIDPETLHKIFSPFYTSKESGTGLGLAISKKLVDAHGGSIEAESQPGQGTEFVLTLPKQSGAAEA